MYLCERMLTEMDVKALVDKRRIKSLDTGAANTKANKRKTAQKIKVADLEDSLRFESDIRSAAALQGAYHNLSKEAHKGHQGRNSKSVVMEATSTNPLDDVLNQMIAERTRKTNMRSVFNEMDEDGEGKISAEQFIAKYYLVSKELLLSLCNMIYMNLHPFSSYRLTQPCLVMLFTKSFWTQISELLLSNTDC